MRRRSRRASLRGLAEASLLVAGCGLAGEARAGPPYATDDPEPTEPGKWEVYAFSTGTLFRQAIEGTGGFDMNYGGAPDLQLSAVVSLGYGSAAGQATQVGVADTEVGAKYRFLHQRERSWVPDLAVFPKLDLPTAGSGFGSGRVGFSVPLWAQKDVGPWSLFGGAGWTLNPGQGNRDYWFGGVALTRSVTKNLALGGELYHQTADASDSRSSAGLGLGASWRIAPHWSIIGSGGPTLEHRAAAGGYAFYLALAFGN